MSEDAEAHALDLFRQAIATGRGRLDSDEWAATDFDALWPQMLALLRRVRAEAREPLLKALRQIKDEATLLALRENAVNAFQVIADHALAAEAEAAP